MNSSGKTSPLPVIGETAPASPSKPSRPVLAEIQNLLANAPDLPACLDVFEKILQSHPQIDSYSFNFIDPGENALVCARVHLPAGHRELESEQTQYSVPINGQDVNAVAFNTRTTVLVTRKNLKSFSTRTQARFEYWNMQHLVALPIQPANINQPAIGTLVLFSTHSRIPLSAITGIKRLLDSAFPLLRLHHKLSRLEARMQSVRDVESEVQSLLHFIAEMNNLTTVQEIYPRIQRDFILRFRLDFTAVLMAESGFLRCVDTRFTPEDAPWGKSWREHCSELSYSLDYFDGACSDAFLNNRPLYFADIRNLLNLPMSKQDRVNLEILKDLRTFAILPIRKHGKPVGVLWLGSLRRSNALSTKQLVLIQHLCDFLGSIIDNAQVYTMLTSLENQVVTLDKLASHDRLTGLHNFGSFEIEINKRLQAFHRHIKPSPMALILCDIDHFKRFNDTHGHPAGNEVLQEIARRITDSVRESDFVARYGGEEFTILLNRCDLKTAVQRAERIRLAIMSEPFYIGDKKHSITLSLGCAEARQSDDVASLIARSDQALYAAKEGGRNRTIHLA
ncbi:MAG: diguanylate cyclase [Proteobacteria bacterium]|nr:diguanylate cyclase [Pseudomonadota bacterium]